MRGRFILASAILLVAPLARAQDRHTIAIEVVEGTVVEGDGDGRLVAGARVTLWNERALPGKRRSPDAGDVPEDQIAHALATVPPALRPLAHRALHYGYVYEERGSTVSSDDGHFSIRVGRPLGEAYEDSRGLAVVADVRSGSQLYSGVVQVYLFEDGKKRVATPDPVRLRSFPTLEVVAHADGAPIASALVLVREQVECPGPTCGYGQVVPLSTEWRTWRETKEDSFAGSSHITMMLMTDESGRAALAVGTGYWDVLPTVDVCVSKPGRGMVHRVVSLERPLELDVALPREEHVTGQVLDPDERPVAGAELDAFGDGESSRRVLAHAKTDATGRFDLGSLGSGCRYTLEVRAPDASLLGAREAVVAPATVSIRLARAAVLEVALAGVEDESFETRLSLDRLDKDAWKEEGGAWFNHGKGTGAFPLATFDGLAPGRYRVRFRPDHTFAPCTSETADVAVGKPARIAIALRPARRVAVRVVTARGRPVEVSYNYTHSRATTYGTSDADGRIEMTDLPWSGEVELHVAADGFEEASVVLADDQTTLDDIVLRPK